MLKKLKIISIEGKTSKANKPYWKVTAQDGAKEIWRATLKARIDGFHELDAFIYAASEMEDRPQERNLFEKAIMEEAKRWGNLAI